ncbi:MAG TPA: hypothetical protein PK079_04235 [Leptospiraceae bacterium]|nr:hypothetical protein [Leptospiraceae bacterium]HMW05446.1 hypothetical protein [Leptospiraceae bacterium]HMX31405.1 hypothetical protein [Leptospiraceae bacterium]HMY30956.1 hypothetical protein [Leptospiraceae bacterium]HMZ63367.1 hypothetical protein [Leptospiraceae bacterium]
MKQTLSFRLRVSIVVFILVLSAFLFFFIIEQSLWLSKIDETNPEVFPRNFFWARLLIASSFSILAGLGAYVFTNNFYESIRHLSHLIQYWSKTLVPNEDRGISIYPDSEVNQIIQFFNQGILLSKQREEDRLKKAIELNNTSIVERLKPFLPESKLGDLENLDVSIFPNFTNNPRCDFVTVIDFELGYLCVMAGFEEIEILDSIYKYKLQGLFALSSGLYNAKEEEILYLIWNAIRSTEKENLNLSLVFVSNHSNHISFLQNQKTAMMILSDNGLSTNVSSEIYFDFKRKDTTFSKTILVNPSYLILLSDRVHEILNINPSDLVSMIESEVFSKPTFKNSKELMLRLSLFLDGFGKSQGIGNTLEYLACIIIKKKG